MKSIHPSDHPDSLHSLLEAYGERCRRVGLDETFERKVIAARDRKRTFRQTHSSSSLWRHMAIAASISLLIGLGVLFREPFTGRLHTPATVVPSQQEALSIIRESLFLVSDELRRGTSLAVEYVDPTLNSENP